MKIHFSYLLCILCMMTIAGTSFAQAHDTRPLYIKIEETNSSVTSLSWKAPPSIAPGQAPLVSLDLPCEAIQNHQPVQRLSGSRLYKCRNGVAGSKLSITYPLYNPSISSLVQIKLNNGEEHTNILNPAISNWQIPQREEFFTVVKSYFNIGVSHIFGGYDHLLFLAGLLYIARGPRRILITITGFTAAHSLTIFLVALNFIRLSVPAIEALIALSTVFLGYEIVRNDRSTLTWKKPALVAAAFGLIHGAGFAVALSEIGLPQTDAITALLFFNIGVEIGQVSIIAFVYALSFLVLPYMRPLLSHSYISHTQLIFGYGLGIISTLWFYQRLVLALV